MQETVNEQIAELRAFQEEMRRQSQDLSQVAASLPPSPSLLLSALPLPLVCCRFEDH